MNERIVIFLKQNLEQYSEIINTLKNDAPFCVECVSFQDLTTEKFNSLLKETSQAHIYFAIDASYYKTIREKLNLYLRSIFQLPFSNYVYIFQEREFMHDHTLIHGKSACFYFSNNVDYKNQINYYIIYQLQLFEKAIVSNRLTEYITDSFKEVINSEILIKKNKEIKQLYEELEEKNRIDYLTNLYNRKALFDFLENERKRTSRALRRLQECDHIDTNKQYSTITGSDHCNPGGILSDHFGIYSILMIDIDNFKKVNDLYGHLIGDKVLRTLGNIILNENILRENDMAGRFGGEEFLIILPETNAHNALKPALRLIDKIKKMVFSDNQGETFTISLSIGISEFNSQDKNNDDVIHRADRALYLAKKQGKGRAIIYEDNLEDLYDK